MVKKNSHFFLKVPLSDTYDFDSSAMVHVVNMNYAKHGLYLSDGKAKETYYFLLCKKNSLLYALLPRALKLSSVIKQIKTLQNFNNISRPLPGKVQTVFDKKKQH